MDHQTFRIWILEDETLSTEEQLKLEQHLAQCPECSRLSQSLNAALQTIRSASELPTPPEFTSRWTASLAARKREQEKKQARVLTITLTSSAFVILLVSFFTFKPEVSLISMAAGFISTVVQLLNGFQEAASFITHLFQTLHPSTLAVTILVIAAWILLASFTLGLSIWKLAIKKKEVTKQ